MTNYQKYVMGDASAISPLIASILKAGAKMKSYENSKDKAKKDDEDADDAVTDAEDALTQAETDRDSFWA
jgi:hypothetical protein